MQPNRAETLTDLRHRIDRLAPSGPGDGAVPGFVTAALVSALLGDTRPVLWCAPAHESMETGRLFAPGLAAHGLAPESVIVADPLAGIKFAGGPRSP